MKYNKKYNKQELNEIISDFKDQKIKVLSRSEKALINAIIYCDSDRFKLYQAVPEKVEKIINKII